MPVWTVIVWKFGLAASGLESPPIGTSLLGARDINQPAPSVQQPNLRPLPQFSDINQLESAFDSSYQSLQAQLQCRFRSGLAGLFSYTWSRSIDNASNVVWRRCRIGISVVAWRILNGNLRQPASASRRFPRDSPRRSRIQPRPGS